MSPITTHVLDTSRGRPAIGVQVALQVRIRGHTGRTRHRPYRCKRALQLRLLGEANIEAGTYRLLFNAGDYYQAQQTETFYSEISIVFEVLHPETHYHVPLLISPFGYSTYRGKLTRGQTDETQSRVPCGFSRFFIKNDPECNSSAAGHARQALRFRFADRAAIDRAQEIIQQALARWRHRQTHRRRAWPWPLSRRNS